MIANEKQRVHLWSKKQGHDKQYNNNGHRYNCKPAEIGQWWLVDSCGLKFDIELRIELGVDLGIEVGIELGIEVGWKTLPNPAPKLRNNVWVNLVHICQQ